MTPTDRLYKEVYADLKADLDSGKISQAEYDREQYLAHADQCNDEREW